MQDYSQNRESAKVHELIRSLGLSFGPMVELGAGDGFHFSNTRFFANHGWPVKMYDYNPKDCPDVENVFITKENVKDLFPLERYVFLSIDLDGNDYWILDEILKYKRPEIICFEVNSQLPLDQALAIPYNPEHKWDGSWFYGMSYLAGAQLCRKYDYTIFTVVNNTNIIAAKSEFLFKPFDFKLKPELYSFGLTYSHPEDNRQFINLNENF